MRFLDQAGRGREGFRMLGIDAAFDAVAAEFNVFLLEAQLGAGGDANLFAHQVDAR